MKEAIANRIERDTMVKKPKIVYNKEILRGKAIKEFDLNRKVQIARGLREAVWKKPLTTEMGGTQRCASKNRELETKEAAIHELR
jgi:hypothetical protein